MTTSISFQDVRVFDKVGEKRFASLHLFEKILSGLDGAPIEDIYNHPGWNTLTVQECGYLSALNIILENPLLSMLLTPYVSLLKTYVKNLKTNL